ncbi:MAG TPA: two-component regulator propeller domain-containing protein [Blastocatellia bacterium]|nr:two-component regulator propeller domain-containing protein [Blastocatellia bacterium]
MSRTILYCATLSIFLVALALLFPRTSIALDPTSAITQYNHSLWRTESGLPQNTVRSILQTQDGYIWLATEEGLVRFDGIRFHVFDKQNTPQIKSNNIQVIFEDKRANLWIGTDEGLIRFSDRAFTAYSTKDGLTHDNIGSIYEDSAGNIWIGTPGGLNRFKDERITGFTTKEGLPSNSVGLMREDRQGNLWISTTEGLARFDGKAFTTYTTQDGLPATYVRAIYESSKGDLWLGTPNGLARFKEGRFTVYTTADGLASNMIWSIEEDASGNLWIGTDGGLNRLSGGKFVAYTTENGLPDNSVLSIYKDRNATLWLGTPGGLARLRGGKLSAYTTREGLSTNTVTSVYEDREGNLWVGTETGGLNLLKDTKFITYTTRDGLSSDMIWTVIEGRDASLWIGTQGGGLNRLKDGKLTAYTAEQGLASNIVRALYEDRKGSLWIGTPAGLTEFNDGRFTTYTILDGLSNNAVWAIDEDGEGNLWIGTLGGLTKLKNGEFKVYTTEDGLPDDAILAVHSDSKGSLWIGTRSGGLCCLRDGRFTTYTSEQGLSDNSVRAIYEDRDGALWIGTRRGGLNRLKDGRLTAITTRNGLFDDCVFQILEDASGNLWMSSAKGVFRASRAELNDFADGEIQAVTSVSYGTADGMQDRECNGGQPAGWRSRDGRLWFPTIKGVAAIDPENIKTNRLPPPVVIEQVIVDNQRVDPSKRIELAAGTDRLEFHYAGLSFIAPEKVRYKYKLEGFDRDWIDAGASRVAYYTSIPPGSYTFRVMASNNDGVWNEAGAAFAFYLKPYFYQTYWFYLLLAAVAALMIWILYLLRIRQVKAKFSAVLDERNRLAREIHDTLAQGFVGIALQLDAVGKTLNESDEKAKRHLELAQTMVNYSLAEARRTVWDLRSQSLEGSDLPGALSNIAEQLTAGTEVEVQLHVTGAPRRLAETVENNLLRIGQEALTNAMKHAAPKKISIELCYEPDRVGLRVRDDGAGFNAQSEQSINGHFGLIGMRERARRMKGHLVVNSNPGQGTEVIATIPSGRVSK